jgi:hypothetical protein
VVQPPSSLTQPHPSNCLPSLVEWPE